MLGIKDIFTFDPEYQVKEYFGGGMNNERTQVEGVASTDVSNGLTEVRSR